MRKPGLAKADKKASPRGGRRRDRDRAMRPTGTAARGRGQLRDGLRRAARRTSSAFAAGGGQGGACDQQPARSRRAARARLSTGQRRVDETRRALCRPHRREHQRAPLRRCVVSRDASAGDVPCTARGSACLVASRAATPAAGARPRRCTSRRAIRSTLSADDVPAELGRQGARDLSSRRRPQDPDSAAGKPAEIIAKMVEGKRAQVPRRDHAAGQLFVKDDKQTVGEAAEEGQRQRWSRSCATKSAPASRRSRRTSRPRWMATGVGPGARRRRHHSRTPQRRGSL